jgi:hypothetical protein
MWAKSKWLKQSEEVSVNDHWHDVPLDRNSGGEAIGRREFLTLMIAASLFPTCGFAQTAEETRARFRKMSEEAERSGLEEAERSGLKEPFKGITTGGNSAEPRPLRIPSSGSKHRS